MAWIRGNIRFIVYQNQDGFTIARFKVKDASNELKDIISSIISIKGIIAMPNTDEEYTLNGEYERDTRYGYEFVFDTYKKEEVKGKEAVIDYLTSDLVLGCGPKTAQAIYEHLGDDAISLIKKDKNSLLGIPLITKDRMEKIYSSIIRNEEADEFVNALIDIGFSFKEAVKLVNKYGAKVVDIASNNIYSFRDYIPFKTLDKIFLYDHEANDTNRVISCALEGMMAMSFEGGSTYYFLEEVADYLKNNYYITLENEQIEDILRESKDIKFIKDKIFLKHFYDLEKDIAKLLKSKMSYPNITIKNFAHHLASEGMDYNDEQLIAISNALQNRVSIISGGPGTGKTTIVKAIVDIYILNNKLSYMDLNAKIALLAPTGRASKKLAESTGLSGKTIHRYLKWNKETLEFGVNEDNKSQEDLIIVDEASMLDTELFAGLLKGIKDDAQLVLVGDTAQLPSVGPGLTLHDLVASKLFPFVSLETIYRQSEDSYIPALCQEIKRNKVSSSYLEKKDDYNFIETDKMNILAYVVKIVSLYKNKHVDPKDIQVLAPMYRGVNGIDNLNRSLQDLLNPASFSKDEVRSGDAIFRVGDRVLQLVNDPDNNVFNGDVGYITRIYEEVVPRKHIVVSASYPQSEVSYRKEDLSNIKHAYAISIHKSQGSDYPIVIMPIEEGYSRMLYNKLIYTGVSRARKVLVIIGESKAFIDAIANDYGENRKTNLIEQLKKVFT